MALCVPRRLLAVLRRGAPAVVHVRVGCFAGVSSTGARAVRLAEDDAEAQEVNDCLLGDLLDSGRDRFVPMAPMITFHTRCGRSCIESSV